MIPFLFISVFIALWQMEQQIPCTLRGDGPEPCTHFCWGQEELMQEGWPRWVHITAFDDLFFNRAGDTGLSMAFDQEPRKWVITTIFTLVS